MSPHPRVSELPAWARVIVVVAHPDDESFGLGALLAGFADRGSEVDVLCFTRGEASTLHGVEGDLAEIRARELADAADALGARRVELLAYPDGGLSTVDLGGLVACIERFAEDEPVDGLVVFDLSGITGHPDHQQATRAALAFADARSLPVLGWTIPSSVAAALNDEFSAGFIGHGDDEMDIVVEVDRSRQRRAIDCHPSQAVPGSALWRRLELLGSREHARWLTSAAADA